MLPKEYLSSQLGATDKKYLPEIRLPVACVDEYAGKVCGRAREGGVTSFRSAETKVGCKSLKTVSSVYGEIVGLI